MDVFAQLFEAFRHDHAMLGRGFNELSCSLRAGDAVGACAAARRLHERAPTSVSKRRSIILSWFRSSAKTVRRMRHEHCGA